MKDLVFKCREGTITFTCYQYPYNKGADGQIYVDLPEIVMQEGSRRNSDPQDTGPALELRMKVLKCLSGLTYKDLKNLSRWADRAAERVKKLEKEGKYGRSFNTRKSVNDE